MENSLNKQYNSTNSNARYKKVTALHLTATPYKLGILEDVQFRIKYVQKYTTDRNLVSGKVSEGRLRIRISSITNHLKTVPLGGKVRVNSLRS